MCRYRRWIVPDSTTLLRSTDNRRHYYLQTPFPFKNSTPFLSLFIATVALITVVDIIRNVLLISLVYIIFKQSGKFFIALFFFLCRCVFSLLENQNQVAHISLISSINFLISLFSPDKMPCSIEAFLYTDDSDNYDDFKFLFILFRFFFCLSLKYRQ